MKKEKNIESIKPRFKKDSTGSEIYEKDRAGNERYPSKGFPFACNSFGNYYYAQKMNGDEFYPKTQCKLCAVINNEDGTIKIACYSSGKQRYPTDKRGNEYYFLDNNNKPYLLKDEKGSYYFAQTNDGEVLIPWSWIMEHEHLMNSLYPGLDSIGNVIFSNKRLSPYIINSCPIICYLFFHIPNILRC